MAKNPLSDLMKVPADADDTSYIFKQLDTASDHAAALLACELLSHGLKKCIIRELTAADEKLVDEILGYRGFLRSFASQIAMGQALGCLGPRVRTELDRVRQIRNAFAHGKARWDFNTDQIKSECLKLDTHKRLKGAHAGRYEPHIQAISALKPELLARHLFIQTSTMLSTALLKDAERRALDPSSFEDVLDLRPLTRTEVTLRRKLAEFDPRTGQTPLPE